MPSRAAAPVVDESCCGPILRTFELYQDCADAAGLYSEVLAGSASASADPARELESLVSLCALLKEERMEVEGLSLSVVLPAVLLGVLALSVSYADPEGSMLIVTGLVCAVLSCLSV